MKYIFVEMPIRSLGRGCGKGVGGGKGGREEEVDMVLGRFGGRGFERVRL